MKPLDSIFLLTLSIFSPNEKGIFTPLLDVIYGGDHYMLCADFEDYIRAQQDVSTLYQDREQWTRKSIINVARSGKFSSDRTIAQYAKEIWGV